MEGKGYLAGCLERMNKDIVIVWISLLMLDGLHVWETGLLRKGQLVRYHLEPYYVNSGFYIKENISLKNL